MCVRLYGLKKTKKENHPTCIQFMGQEKTWHRISVDKSNII